MKPNFVLNPSWPNYAGVAATFLALVFGAVRYFLVDWFDPNHCQSLLGEGRWMDSKLKLWQPQGCTMHTYKPKEVSQCAPLRDFVFVGDSVTRNLFFQFANILDPALPTVPPDDEGKHADHHLRAATGVQVSFYWDPFLNHTRTYAFLTTDVSAFRITKKPTMLVLGSGLWHLRYADTSGGLPSWEANVERLLSILAQAAVKPADEVVILPVQQVVASKLTQERAETIRPSDIDAMNSDLYHRIRPRGNYLTTIGQAPPLLDVALPTVFNDMLVDGEASDGLHFSSTVVKAQANLLLNLHCNKNLPNHFPYDTTCCRRYPWPRLAQIVVLLATVAWGPVSVLASQPAGQRFRHVPSVKAEHIPRLIFSGAILVIYLADRTNVWLKEHKHFNGWTFAFLNILALGLGLATVRRSDKDLGFLHRDQTDEWKGWMQIAILIYHFFGGSKISGVYNPIRVLVAAYLFMTGYGHGTYYIKKADFGFLRIAQVMVRLNVFTLLLAYVMDTDYISYYFAPLVSFWFLIIYATMATLPQYNDHTPFLVAKLLASATAVAWFMKTEWLLNRIFDFLRQIFRIEWSAREWAFRVNLDLWIVYAGILTAIAVIKIREHHITDHPRWSLAVTVAIGASALVMVWFFAFELLQESKFTYNAWHPYVSFLPVLAFAVLRNSSVVLRSASSRAFAFVGKCSLETFIIQFHFWLAGDTKDVLLIIPGTGWRPVNFVITTSLFFFLSHWVTQAAGQLTVWICSDPAKENAEIPAPTIASQTERAAGSATLETMKAEGEGQSVTTETPPRRWLDRLAEGTAPESAAATISWQPGLKGKLAAGLGVMWLLNLLWVW